MCLSLLGGLGVPVSGRAAGRQATDRGQPPEAAPRPDVVVIPFSNITGEPADDWIGAGIAETVMADLQEIRGLSVLGRTRPFDALEIATASDGTRPDEPVAVDIGRLVGATWLVSGGYQRLADLMRITARFVDVRTGTVIRAIKIDGQLSDLFDLQDRVADALNRELRLALGEAPTAPIDSRVAATPVAEAPRPDATGVEGGDQVAPAVTSPREADPTGAASPRESTPTTIERRSGAAASPASTPPGVPSPSEASSAALLLGVAIDGPPPPVPPAVVSRDAEGRVTLRAIRIDRPLTVDGRLDDEIYQLVLPVSDFIQQVPREGELATEQTEVWVFFDDDTLYVAARCWDSQPERMVANEMRRDSNALVQNENFSVVLDTFHDRRNGYAFQTNPLGALRDQIFTNEGNFNNDWNTVWNPRSARFADGWTTEIAIPFKSLRYTGSGPQVWGINLRRIVRWKNEWSTLAAVPASYGPSGMYKVSSAATLVGLETPPRSLNIEVKPYGIGGTTTDVTADRRNDRDGDFGVDVKYGITQSLTADITYNTDFAQVEVDEQQVNLTRFSLFFPEKREFFLEGRGIFDFARGGGGGGRGGGGRGGGGRGGGAPTMFFSRRIGLERGTVVPIPVGGRLTGKLGPFDVGALNIQADASPETGVESTNFTVVRLKRDLLRRSSIGGIFTNRTVSRVGDGSNQAYGLDATFSFYDNLSFLTYYARTRTPGVTERDRSYQGRFGYNGDRYGLTVDHLVVEDNFIPEVGFVRRDNFRRTNVSAEFTPRPRGIELVRQFTFAGSLDYFLTADEGFLETRDRQFRFQAELENSDRFGANVSNSYELLQDPFEISDGVTIPVGGHSFSTVELSYAVGAQRRVSGNLAFAAGNFWTGDIKTVSFSRGRINLLDQFSIEPGISFNWVDLPEGSFNTTLVSSRVNYSFNPRMFLSGLLQYNSNSRTWSNNLRVRWEYTPGSELFVVYTEDRNVDSLVPNRFSELRNRGFVVKATRLFRF